MGLWAVTIGPASFPVRRLYKAWQIRVQIVSLATWAVFSVCLFLSGVCGVFGRQYQCSRLSRKTRL